MTQANEQGRPAATSVEELLAAYSQDMPRLRRFVQRFVGSPSEAEEIAQDAFCRVLQASRFVAVHAVRAYLFSTARNLAIKHRRRVARHAEPAMEENEELELISDEPSPDRQAATRQEFTALIDALDTLPAQCRRVLVLRKVYGLSQKEIAAELGVTESTVEKHVIKGLMRCRQYVRERGFEVESLRRTGKED